MLEEYDHQVGLYQDLAATVALLLERMFQGTGVQLHSITHRYKSRKSLSGKLARPNKEYHQLSEVTDLAAVRVTTYFGDDIDLVAEVVEREFLIDTANSIDKRKLLDPDRFGYQSLHYIASVSPERCKLVEYSRFSERRFEIQVRSILQHAWAEIEHDLGYKSAAGVPKEIRRRFSRIAGLLELADDEFSTIRKELKTYARTVSREIRSQPENVGVDKISLRALLSSKESAVYRLSLSVANIARADLASVTDELLESNVAILNLIHIPTIAEVEQCATSHLTLVEKFAKRFLGQKHHVSVDPGVGILYLAYVVLAEQGDKKRLRNFVKQARLGPGSVDEIVNHILETYRAVLVHTT